MFCLCFIYHQKGRNKQQRFKTRIQQIGFNIFSFLLLGQTIYLIIKNSMHRSPILLTQNIITFFFLFECAFCEIEWFFNVTATMKILIVIEKLHLEHSNISYWLFCLSFLDVWFVNCALVGRFIPLFLQILLKICLKRQKLIWSLWHSFHTLFIILRPFSYCV